MRLVRSTIGFVGLCSAVALAAACGDSADDTVNPLDAGGTPDTSVRDTGVDATAPPDAGPDATVVDATTADVAVVDAADASDSSDATASDASDASAIDASVDAQIVDASAADAASVDASDASSASDASDGGLPEGGNICGGFCGIAKFCCTKITSVDYGKCVGTLNGCK